MVGVVFHGVKDGRMKFAAGRSRQPFRWVLASDIDDVDVRARLDPAVARREADRYIGQVIRGYVEGPRAGESETGPAEPPADRDAVGQP